MCTMSMVGDHYMDIWKERPWYPSPSVPAVPMNPTIPLYQTEVVSKLHDLAVLVGVSHRRRFDSRQCARKTLGVLSDIACALALSFAPSRRCVVF